MSTAAPFFLRTVPAARIAQRLPPSRNPSNYAYFPVPPTYPALVPYPYGPVYFTPAYFRPYDIYPARPPPRPFNGEIVPSAAREQIEESEPQVSFQEPSGDYGYVMPYPQPYPQPYYYGGDMMYQDRPEKLNVHMGVDELHEGILSHLENHQICRVSWLNRLLAKCSTAEDFEKGLEVYRVYQGRGVELPAETGTLLLKAGCRAEIPSRVLQLLTNKELEILPTLGGIHYLMINFSLKNDSVAVMDAFQVAQELNLKPNQRSYHILIRECVDHDLIDEALSFAAECKTAKIVPNRVTYNILMNGCRKANKPQAILQLREEMNQHGIEINDTTVKFTALAHMMLNNVDDAVQSFLSFPEIDSKLAEFANKFFEITEEDLPHQKNSVVQLFDALKARTQLSFPDSIEAKLKSLRSQIENL